MGNTSVSHCLILWTSWFQLFGYCFQLSGGLSMSLIVLSSSSMWYYILPFKGGLTSVNESLMSDYSIESDRAVLSCSTFIKVVLTFRSVDETPMWSHTNENFWAVCSSRNLNVNYVVGVVSSQFINETLVLLPHTGMFPSDYSRYAQIFAVLFFKLWM